MASDIPNVETEENAPVNSLINVLNRVETWSSDGTFDNIDRFIRFANAMMDSATTETVVRLMRVVAPLVELAHRVFTSEIGQRLPDLLDALDKVQMSPIAYEKHEIRHLMQALRDPEAQMGINFTLEALRALGPIIACPANSTTKA